MLPLQSRKLSQRTALTTSFMRLVAKVGIREPCVEPREDGEVSLQASAPRHSSIGGDMGERNEDRGGCHQGVVVEVLWQETSAGGAVRTTGDRECRP